MSQTNIDFLFQVTSADRPYALPRGDADRPPFGDLLSHVTANTVAGPSSTTRRDDNRYAPADSGSSSAAATSGSDDQLAESTSDETSEESAAADVSTSAGDSESADASQNDPADAAGDVNERPAADETAERDGDDESEDDAEQTAEAATGQAAAIAKQDAKVAAERAVDNEVDNIVAASLKEAAGGEENGETHGSTSESENEARSSASVGEVAETSAADNADVQDAKANAGATDAAAVKGGKKSRHAGTSANGANQHGENEPAVGAENHGNVGGNGEASALAEKANDGTKAEPASAEQLTGDAHSTKSDESNDSPSDRANSRTRTDNAAAATKIVAAVINAVTTPAGDNRVKSSNEDSQSVVKPTGAKTDALSTAADRLQQHAIGKRGAKADGADDMPRVDAARFVGRVAKAFQTAHERGGTLQLRLNPPELGALRLELTVKDGVMTAALETESNTTRRVLLDHLPALRERLAEQNIRVERFDVDVRRDGGGQQDTAPQNQQHGRQNHSDSRREPGTQPRTEDNLPRERTIVQPQSNNSGINLVA